MKFSLKKKKWIQSRNYSDRSLAVLDFCLFYFILLIDGWEKNIIKSKVKWQERTYQDQQ